MADRFEDGPVRRVMRRAGFSTPSMIQQALGISRQYEGTVNRAQLTELPVPILERLQDTEGVDTADLDNLSEDYREFQRRRRAHYGKLLPLEMPPREKGESPIEWLVRAVGSAGRLSNWLCIHDYTMNEYIKGVHAMPEVLPLAIEESGWRWGQSFLAACRAWDNEQQKEK